MRQREVFDWEYNSMYAAWCKTLPNVPEVLYQDTHAAFRDYLTKHHPDVTVPALLCFERVTH